MTENQTTPEVNELPPTPATLNVQDLTLVLQMIGVATSRGAFKAEELTVVGGLHDRVFNFLKSTGAIVPDAAETPAEETPAV